MEIATKGTIFPFILSFVQPTIVNGIDKNEEIGTAEHPIVIRGPGNRTGMTSRDIFNRINPIIIQAKGRALAEYSASDGMNTITMTRSAKDPFKIVKLPPSTQSRLGFYDRSVDVRDYDSILTAFQQTNPSVVVFAASASKQGGNSFDVDALGASNVAKACKSVGAKLILISALAVDRPNSKSFQITNTIGGYMDKIMDAKLQGENQAKNIMKNSI